MQEESIEAASSLKSSMYFPFFAIPKVLVTKSYHPPADCTMASGQAKGIM